MLSGTAGTALALQPGRLALASSTLPPATVVGMAITPIGACAALTALSALTMPAPHWLGLEPRQEHSPLVMSLFGQTGTPPVLAGNAVALACRRATSWAGVRFALAERINAAIPETIGVAK